MNSRLRWGLAAGATLVAVIALLLWRLDADELRLHIAERLSATLQQPVTVGSAKLSLLHGLSFDLEKIEILPEGKRRLSLQANQTSVQLDLIDLLRGDVDVTGIFLLTPKIVMPDEAFQNMRLPAGLELKQLKIQNGEILREDGEQIASDVFLDVRNVLPGKDMRWEFSADVRDGGLRTFGQATLRGRDFASAFGKLEIEGVPVAALPLDALPAWLNGRQVGCRLTFNLDRSGAWKLDGDLDINLPDHARADIQLRGELTGSTSTGQFAWQDSFAHIGGKSVFTTQGEGLADGTLGARLRGKQLKLAELLAVAGINWPVSSLAGIDANVRYDGNNWLSEGKLTLGKLQWADKSLPDLDAKFQGLRWKEGRLDLAQMQLTHPGMSGETQLNSLQWSKDDLDLEIQLQAVENWWEPLLGAVLAGHGASDPLSGEGLLTGRLGLRSNSEGLSLDIVTDATDASLNYGALKKPKGIESSGKLSIQNRGAQKTWQLADIRLGNSRLNHGDWLQDRQQQKLQLQEMQLDATELGAMGVWGAMRSKKWRGQVSGDLHATRSGQDIRRKVDDLASWLNSARANLNMTQFGLADTWSGDLALRQGQATAAQLTWHSDGGSVQMSGNVNLRNRSGSLDITQAAIDTASLSDIGDFLAEASLDGRLAATKLATKWFEFRDTEASYRLRNGSLKLTKIQAAMADGLLRADSLSLDLANPRWPISIPGAHLHKVQLDGLAGGFQGRLFATLGLYGYLRGGGKWRANGDIEMFSGMVPGINLAARIGELTGSAYEKQKTSTAFSKLSARFRMADGILRLQHIQMDAKAFSLKGAGNIDMNTRIPDVHLDTTLHAPLLARLKPGKSYVEHDGSVHAPLLVSGRYPDISLDLNQPKLDQIHLMKDTP